MKKLAVILLFIFFPALSSAEDIGGHKNVNFNINAVQKEVSTGSKDNKAGRQQGSYNIAVVDVEYVLDKSVAVAGIRQSINEISDAIRKELSEKEVVLKKMEEELIKQRGAVAEAVFNEKLAAFNHKISEAQQDMQLKKSMLETAHADAISKVHKELMLIIAELAKKNSFQLVMPGSNILFVQGDLNITFEVLSILNERLKTVKVTYGSK